MRNVQAFTVSQKLLHISSEDEVGEKSRRRWMSGRTGDGRRRNHKRDTVLRIDNSDWIALFSFRIEKVLSAIRAHYPFSCRHDLGRIVNRLGQMWLVLG